MPHSRERKKKGKGVRRGGRNNRDTDKLEVALVAFEAQHFWRLRASSCARIFFVHIPSFISFTGRRYPGFSTLKAWVIDERVALLHIKHFHFRCAPLQTFSFVRGRFHFGTLSSTSYAPKCLISSSSCLSCAGSPSPILSTARLTLFLLMTSRLLSFRSMPPSRFAVLEGSPISAQDSLLASA